MIVVHNNLLYATKNKTTKISEKSAVQVFSPNKAQNPMLRPSASSPPTGRNKSSWQRGPPSCADQYLREFSFVPLGLYPWVLGPYIMEHGPVKVFEYGFELAFRV